MQWLKNFCANVRSKEFWEDYWAMIKKDVAEINEKQRRRENAARLEYTALKQAEYERKLAKIECDTAFYKYLNKNVKTVVDKLSPLS